MSDGTRKVTAISEITGMEGDMISLQDIFIFERRRRTAVSVAVSAPWESGRSVPIGWRRLESAS